MRIRLAYICFVSALLLVACAPSEDLPNHMDEAYSSEHEELTESTSMSDYSFYAEPELLSSVALRLDETPELPVVHATSSKLTTQGVYTTLTNKELDATLTEHLFYYPGEEGSSKTILLGEPPFYDLYLNIEETILDSRVYYLSGEYNYIATVFSPDTDVCSIDNTEFAFESSSDAKAAFSAIMHALGMDVEDVSCYGLSAESLQALYTTRKENGTLLDQRYGTGDSTIKNESSVLEKDLWTDSDECYYIEGSPSLLHTKVYGSVASGYLSQTGWINFSATGLLEINNYTPSQKLASSSLILCALSTIADQLYSEDTPILSSMDLYYYPVEIGTYSPIWCAEMAYTFTNPDGIKEHRTAQVWLDAYTGEELAIGKENGI